MKTVWFRRGYKYQLANTYRHETGFVLGRIISTEFIRLNQLGVLEIRSGYAWDGPSGPAIDTMKTFGRGSLVHDALYQLMRQGHLSDEWRKPADALLRDICREDGMNPIRAWWVYHAVQTFAKRSSTPEQMRKVHQVP